ncbi:flagellar attachment zone protein 1-like [Periplaneta americana]|uniref:flagellar attachment zone protein 1-like n=1 Tax=Periplaneta americana TaxID=6978 RepID=UPI0037E6FFC8
MDYTTLLSLLTILSAQVSYRANGQEYEFSYYGHPRTHGEIMGLADTGGQYNMKEHIKSIPQVSRKDYLAPEESANKALLIKLEAPLKDISSPMDANKEVHGGDIVSKTHLHGGQVKHIPSPLDLRKMIGNRHGNTYSHETHIKGVSQTDEASRALLADVVAKTYGREARLKEEAASEFLARAKLHEHFAEIYSNLSREFEEKSKDKIGQADFQLKEAKSHDKLSSEISTKAKETLELVGNELNIGGEHLNSYIDEYWIANIANNNARETLAYVKNEEARSKGEFIKYAEMEKLANVLLDEAKAYEELGRAAQEKAKREKKTSEEKSALSSKFLMQAIKYLLPKVFELRRKARMGYTSYLDNFMKAELEEELAREDHLKATYEMKLSNALLKNAQQNSAFATLEKDRYHVYKLKAEELLKVMDEPATAELVVSSKELTRKAMKVLESKTQS